MKLTYLDLSTCHVRQETMAALGVYESGAHDMGWPAMTIASYECGAFITVPSEMSNEQMDALPSDLEEVLSWARAAGATLVRLNADGAIDPDLPTFEW